MNKKKRVRSKKPAIKYLSWNEISENLESLKTNTEKIDYLKKALSNPDFLREKVKQKAYKLLGEEDIEIGDIKDAKNAFNRAGEDGIALECYRTIHTFTEKDEEELKRDEEKLKEVILGKKPSPPPEPPKDINEVDDLSRLKDKF